MRGGSLFPCGGGHYCLRERSLLLAGEVGIHRNPFGANLLRCSTEDEYADLQVIHVRGSGVRPRIRREGLDTRLSALRGRSLFPCVEGLYSLGLARNSGRRVPHMARGACVGGHYSRGRAEGRSRAYMGRPPSLLAATPASRSRLPGRVVDGP